MCVCICMYEFLHNERETVIERMMQVCVYTYVCMCVYIYMYVYVSFVGRAESFVDFSQEIFHNKFHVHVHQRVDMYTHTHTYLYIYIHTHTYIHTHRHHKQIRQEALALYIYIYTHIHTYIHTSQSDPARSACSIYTHIYIHTYIHHNQIRQEALARAELGTPSDDTKRDRLSTHAVYGETDLDLTDSALTSELSTGRWTGRQTQERLLKNLSRRWQTGEISNLQVCVYMYTCRRVYVCFTCMYVYVYMLQNLSRRWQTWGISNLQVCVHACM